jgi:hypothetical protein
LYDDYVGLKQPSSRAATTNSQPVEEEDIWTMVISVMYFEQYGEKGKIVIWFYLNFL